MDRVRYWLALMEVTLMPGAMIYWFSIHPFVRFWRRVGARATVTLHVLMIFVVGYGMYLLRGRLLAVEYGTSPLLIAISVAVLIASFVLKRALGRHLKFRILIGVPELSGVSSRSACCAKGFTPGSGIRGTWRFCSHSYSTRC